MNVKQGGVKDLFEVLELLTLLRAPLLSKRVGKVDSVNHNLGRISEYVNRANAMAKWSRLNSVQSEVDRYFERPGSRRSSR